MSPNSHSSKRETRGRDDGREVEWQFGCDDLEAARRWLCGHSLVDGWTLEPAGTQQLVDVYFDTGDWRLFRAGFALRLRSDSARREATLKSLRSDSAEFADRLELHEPLDDSGTDWVRASRGPVGTRVLAVSGSNALRPLFEVRTARRRFIVMRSEEAGAQGEIALDESVFSPPGGEPTARLQCVELEALTPDPAPLRALAGTLREACALRPPRDNKFSLGLRSAGLVPVTAPDFAPAAVTEDMTMTEVALANLRRHVSAWHLREPGARLGDDPEELHELRLAVRRVDAIMRDFHAYLPALSDLRPVLKRLLRALGEARDLDVALADVDAFSGDLEPGERQEVEPLRRLLSADRDRVRGAMTRVLDSATVGRALHTLTLLLMGPPAAAGADAAAAAQSGSAPTLPSGSARREAPLLLRRRYRQMRRAADRLDGDASPAAHHALRGQVKKLRYALETVAALYGKPALRLLRSLRRWQERLGVQQDAAVAAHRLQALAAAPPDSLPPPTVFLMGRLAEHHESLAARARERQGKKRGRLRGRWKRLRAAFAEE